MADKIQLNRGASGLALQKNKIVSLRTGRQAEPEQEPQKFDHVGDIQKEAEEELSEVLSGFKQRAEIEEQRFLDATDSEYWFCLCFQTREQKEEFLEKIGLMELGDKYIDGMKAAQKLGITMTSRVPPMPRHRPFDRDLLRLVRK